MKAAKFFPVTNGSCCHCDDYQQFRTIVDFLLEVSLVKVYSCKTESWFLLSSFWAPPPIVFSHHTNEECFYQGKLKKQKKKKNKFKKGLGGWGCHLELLMINKKVALSILSNFAWLANIFIYSVKRFFELVAIK